MPQGTRAQTAAAAQSAPPVVTVVHRLSGWRLRALVTPPDAPIAAAFDEKFIRTSIVAGYVLPDGHTVVARLPQAEAELLNTASRLPELKAAPSAESGLSLVRRDGSRFAARFIGLDASTGLSLLESSEPLLPQTPATAGLVTVGTRLCIYAPLPSGATNAGPATAGPVVAPAAAGTVLYVSLAELNGTLREIRRSPTGRARAYGVQVDHVSPEWIGGVALTESGGALVGVVEQGAGHEAQLLPADVMRAAVARVRARRASVPQPWLGARGDAVALTPPEKLTLRGWPRDQAWTLVRRQQGVLLTAVAPDSPAARAGLLPGDVIARVGGHDVRNVEDMTWMLRELGGNSTADFTVLRAGSAPKNLSVKLSEAQNPAAATAQAEALAAEAKAIRLRTEATRLESEIARLQSALSLFESRATGSTESGGASVSLARQRELMQAQLRGFEEQLRRISFNAALVEKSLTEAQSHLSAALTGLSSNPLLPFGVETAVYSPAPTVDETSATKKRLMIIAVRPGSPAEQSGARVGDLIESVDGQTSLGFEWRLKHSPEPDSDITLAVLREGKRLTLKLRRPAP